MLTKIKNFFILLCSGRGVDWWTYCHIVMFLMVCVSVFVGLLATLHLGVFVRDI